MHDLTHFRDEDLLSLARNPSAQARVEAIRQLVDRGSALAAHPDIVEEASAYIHNNPKILKKMRPTVNYGGALPGVVDVLCRTNDRQSAVEDRACKIEEKALQHEEKLLAASEELHSAITTTDAYVKDLEHRYELTRIAFQELSAKFDQTVQLYEERFALVERSPARKLYDWAIVPVSVAISTFCAHAVAWAKGLF